MATIITQIIVESHQGEAQLKLLAAGRAADQTAISYTIDTPARTAVLLRSSADTSHSRLPVEISDSIIDELYDDRQTLYACSLASRQLLWRSRTHLFREVTLQDKRSCQILSNVLASAGLYPSGLAFYIRALTIKKPSGWGAASSATWMEDELPVLLGPKLVYVQRLILDSMIWPMGTRFHAREAILSLTSVQSVTLRSMVFATSDDIIGLLHGFPKLSGVHMVDVRCSPVSSINAQPLRSPDYRNQTAIDVSDLLVEDEGGVGIESLANMLLQAPFQLSLTRLTWRARLNVKTCAFFRDLLERSSTYLQHLELGHIRPRIDDMPSLEKFKELTSLRLLCPQRGSRWVPYLLDTVASTHMDTIILVVGSAFHCASAGLQAQANQLTGGGRRIVSADIPLPPMLRRSTTIRYFHENIEHTLYTSNNVDYTSGIHHNPLYCPGCQQAARRNPVRDDYWDWIDMDLSLQQLASLSTTGLSVVFDVGSQTIDLPQLQEMVVSMLPKSIAAGMRVQIQNKAI